MELYKLKPCQEKRYWALLAVVKRPKLCNMRTDREMLFVGADNRGQWLAIFE